MIQVAKKRLRSDPLSFYLGDFSNEAWICAMPGPLNQAMRRKAVALARDFLWNHHIQPSKRHCFDILEFRAGDIHNHRPPHGNEERYLQFRLEIVACIRWLAQHGEQNSRGFVEKIAQVKKCFEITTLLANEQIP